MKKILLIGNKSLNQEKFVEQNALLLNSAEELNCELIIKTNFEVNNLLLNDKLEKYDAVLFYDKDIILAKKLEILGYKLFNSSNAILNCDSKALTEMCLNKANLPRPKTCVIPMTFYYNKDYYKDYIDNLVEYLKLPLICKEWFGSWGQQVYKLSSKEEIQEIIDKKQGKELLFQEYIECGNEDIRLNVVGDKVVATMKRKAKANDFRANISNNGSMDTYTPTEKEKELAIKSSKSLGCDFCGVDILQSKNGPLVCEVNSNAQLVNIYKCTGKNVGKEILKYIISKI